MTQVNKAKERKTVKSMTAKLPGSHYSNGFLVTNDE